MEACVRDEPIQGVSSSVKELRRRIEDELRNRAFAYVPLRRMQFYTREMHWPEAVSAFPSIRPDLKESRMCFLFGRFTASVFHSQRVLEVGLHALAKALNISTDSNRSWDSILRKIDDEVKKRYPQQDPNFSSKSLFYSEGAAMFRTVKISWRNPTMHVERAYGEKEAREILMTVKTFMRHLAKGLHE